MNDWIQTKKEKKVLEGENIIITTEEPYQKKRFSQESKELIDLVVKVLGAASIFIPLFLLYFQYKHEVTKERNEELSQIYIDASFDVQAVKNYRFSSSQFTSASENLLFKYPAKIAVFKIDSLNFYYNNLITIFEYYEAIKALSTQLNLFSSGYANIYGNYSISHAKLNGVTTKFELKFSDMSEIEKVSQIQRYLTIFKDSINLSNSGLIEKLSEIPNIYSSDTLLSKINLYSDSAFSSYDDIYEELSDLRLYLTDKKNMDYADFYVDVDPSEPKSINTLTAMSTLINKCKNKLEDFLDNSRIKFQSQVLKHIKD